jgi:methyltransferase (TIGR00027 family)
MKPGQASKTAVFVCMGRAVADGAAWAAGFSDPTARVLLSEKAKARVDWARSGARPRGLREGLAGVYLHRGAKAMAARTIEIDRAVREAKAPQVVILGAGLDGRAWRMPEVAEAIVFEVDHPDSQRVKRRAIDSEGLERKAREVRFVAVDFSRDRLDDALAAAGHDPALPTTWIWEGVVMYLDQPAIEATLEVVARRSASGSRLAILYHRRAFITQVVGLAVRWLGEPLRTAFEPEAMRTLLAKHGFAVARDADLAAIGGALSPEIGAATKRMHHLRIVIALRR